MRLFTAVDIPDPLREALTSVQDRHDLSVRWTDANQLHITLRFIGEVDEEQAHRLDDVLSNVDVPPVRCVPQQPSALDTLPSRHSPRVVMLELERTESMMRLYRAVSDALEDEGLDPEERTYRPHVTIGRLDDADPEAVHSLLRAEEDQSFSSFEADHFVLYESTLTPEGAIHEVQAKYELAA